MPEPEPLERLKAALGDRYALEREIGAGGMATVYLAQDLKHRRSVAVKVILPDVATTLGASRFLREIQVAAKLQHPHIVPLHDSGEVNGLPYYVMPYVEGESLRERLNRDGRLPIGEALQIAREVAGGLGYAHAVGVIHRDIKPENILLSRNHALIADFGVARAVSSAGDGTLTRTGTSVGTPLYMSPEQTAGDPGVDQRSDIYSLGCVLYELVTGSVPFQGDTPLGIAIKHLSDTPPDPMRLNPGIPDGLRRLILNCMEKERENRYQTATELLADLRKIEGGLPLESRAVPTPGRRTEARKWSITWKSAMLYGGAPLLAMAGLLAVWSLPRRSAPDRPMTIGQVTMLTSEDGTETHPSLSPEGNLLAYAASGDIYLRRVGTENPILLTGDLSLEASEPAFSPDGRLIAFSARLDGTDVRGGVWLMEVMGAGKRRLTEEGFSPAWSPDGREIAYATEFPTPYDRPRRSRVKVVDVASGRTREVTSEDPYDDMMEPSWSPSGRRLAYWALVGISDRDILTRPAEGGEATPVTSDPFTDWSPVWSLDGHYLFFVSDRGGSPNLWRVRIDEETGRVLGPPEPLTLPAASVMRVDFAADSKSFAFEASDLQANVYRIPFDPAAESVGDAPVAMTSGTRVWMDVDVSVEGRLVMRSAMRQEDIYVSDADGGRITPLAPDPGFDRFPRWSPDGTRIAFSSTKGDEGYEIHSIRADGLDLRRHTFFEATAVHFPLWSPDGRRLAFTEYVTAGGRTYVIDVDEPWPGEPLTPLLTPPGPLDLRYRPWSWSPDGRRIVAYSQRGAGMIVYDVATGANEPISDVGEKPRWLGDSRRVVYIHDGAFHLVDSQTKASREIYRPPAGSITDVAVAHDDRALYFILRRDEGNIWLATLR